MLWQYGIEHEARRVRVDSAAAARRTVVLAACSIAGR